MIAREGYHSQVSKALRRVPIVALLGPRQCGKTTLAREFLSVHAGSELDLLMDIEGRRIGVEVKRADAPTVTKSMQIALQDAKLDALWVVYPGSREYALTDRITVRPLANCLGQG